jgi:hypothetical protein
MESKSDKQALLLNSSSGYDDDTTHKGSKPMYKLSTLVRLEPQHGCLHLSATQ